jgi:ATP-dependent exoDNAse (exonuclease V) beta subunit
VVRDRQIGARRARPDDIAILFRARSGHQFFEEALETRGIRTYVYKGLGFFDAPEVQDLQALIRYLAEPDSSLRAAEFLRSRLVRLSDRALVSLAPDFAGALRGDLPEISALDDVDRRLLAGARGGVARWLAHAARVTPSELLDEILRESAYALELGGRRRNQARENVKKVRALVRRVENRGYATLGRIAEYFETLRAGDESNAIVEARDAVNLMTIHSAKGLEFPIVFVVNVHVGGRNRPPGFSIIERGAGGDPEVAFHTTDGTKLEDLRETEELRRLCYVAVTRARDRLYLAGEVDQKGRLRRGFRSLSTLFPQGLASAFDQASLSTEDTVTWTSQAGEFDFAICRPSTRSGRPELVEGLVESARQPPASPAAPLQATGRPRVPATSISDRLGLAMASHQPAEAASTDRLVGTLVHRLFHRRLDAAADDAELQSEVRRLIRAEEAIDVEDLDALVASAAAMYRRLRLQPEVAALLEAGQCHYEVPFSVLEAGEVVRGVIDCVVLGLSGEAVGLEFKTGQPRASHERQAEVYSRAVSAIFQRQRVEVKIIYP